MHSNFSDVLFELSKTLSGLHDIIQQVEFLAESGVAGAVEAPYLIEVTLPMLCCYLPTWWRKGPECIRLGENELTGAPRDSRAARPSQGEVELASKIGLTDRQSIDSPLTRVTADLMNRVLGSVLQLIQNNIDSPHAPWMTRIASKFWRNWFSLVLFFTKISNGIGSIGKFPIIHDRFYTFILVPLLVSKILDSFYTFCRTTGYLP